MPVLLPESTDVVVIGAGIVGASVAYNLAKSGFQVVIVERGDFCGEASGANVGLLTAATKVPGLLFELAHRGVQRYATLTEELGKDIKLHQIGTLVVATTPEELAERRALTEAQRAAGMDIQHVTAEEARAIEPRLPGEVLGGAFYPLDGYVYPFLVVSAYLDAAASLGARFVPHTTVRGVRVEGNRVAGVETDRGRIACSWVVNAAGAWAHEVSAMVGLHTPMVPVRGQVLVTEPVGAYVSTIVMGFAPSLRPTWAGNLTIGSTTEQAGYVKQTSLAVIRRYAQGIVALYPDLAETQVIRGWTGLRPGTPDGLPYLGESEQVGGFVLATGTFRDGVLYAPAVGEVIAAAMRGEAPPFDIAEASPERFEAARATAS